MRRHAIGIVGVALIVIALVGAAITAALIPGSQPTRTPFPGMMGGPRNQPPGTSGPYGGYATPGERIYYTGVGHAGAIPRSGGFGMMASGGCVNCHRSDGRGGPLGGGMMGGAGVDAADIRFSSLTETRTEDGTSVPGWTEAQIATAIRDGREPDGRRLSPYMPRWQMDDQDFKDVLAYLKELK